MSEPTPPLFCDIALLPELLHDWIYECESGCWEWIGARNGGYGRPKWEGQSIYAHRLVYQLFIGPVPAGEFLDHLCRNRACVNPAHLEPVPPPINVRRGRVSRPWLLEVVPETPGMRPFLARPEGTERWLDVVGYEGLYEVSDLGRVRSLIKYGRGLRGRILKQYQGADGRVEVKLWRAGEGKTCYVYRLVAEAFIGPKPEGLETRHLNDVPTDNRLVNLTYGTSRENKQDMLRNGGNYFANVTHCGTCGTPYDEANTMYRRDGRGRECRACHNAATARRRLNENAGIGTPCTTSGCEGVQIALGLCRPCYTRKRAEERRGPDWEKRTCPQCGIDFERELAPGQGKRKFCSDACAKEFKRITCRDAMRAKRAAAKRAKAA